MNKEFNIDNETLAKLIADAEDRKYNTCLLCKNYRITKTKSNVAGNAYRATCRFKPRVKDSLTNIQSPQRRLLKRRATRDCTEYESMVE